MKFKIGDKVKYIGLEYPGESPSKKEIYVVSALQTMDEDNYIGFKISESLVCNHLQDEELQKLVDGIRAEWHESDFELIEVAHKMKVTKNDQISYFDVDQTLITWVEPSDIFKLKADYYGETVYVKPYYPHIRFLKSLKARGGYIVVHSGNGWAWAEQIVKLLELEDYVDEVKTKPYKVIDDSDYSDWMPTRIFIKE